MNLQCTSGSRSFAKELRHLKMRSIVTGQWKVTMINWEQSSKLILLQLHKKLLKNPVLTILWSFSIWSKLEKWKSLISRCLMSWSQVKKKKKTSFWSVIFSYFMQQKQIISWLDCDIQWIVDFTITSNDQFSGWTEKKCSKVLPTAKLVPKDVMVTASWCAACLIHYSFLNPGETITSE